MRILETCRCDDNTNAFMLMLLEAGARRFRGENMMETNVFNYISVQEVNDIYKTRITLIGELSNVQLQQMLAEQSIMIAKAKKAQEDPDFDWGKNVEMRELTARRLFPNEYAKISEAEQEIKKIERRMDVNKLEMERISFIKNMFLTNVFDLGAEEVSPS